MTGTREADVRAIVIDLVTPRLERAGKSAAELEDSTELLQSGLIDSFEFLDLITEIEQRAGVEIDLAAMEDDDIGTVGGLVRYVLAAKS